MARSAGIRFSYIRYVKICRNSTHDDYFFNLHDTALTNARKLVLEEKVLDGSFKIFECTEKKYQTIYRVE